MRWLPDAFYANKYQPWLGEKYGDSWDTPQHRKKTIEKEKDYKFDKDRMVHGSKKTGKTRDSIKYKAFMKRARDKNKLRPGEVKKFVNGKWVSNKD